MENKLWYVTPPSEWMEGLPIGNGRLAAMIWGDERTDRITLNHEWLWRGVHRERDNEPVHEHLQEVRECLRRGDFFRATSLANAWFGGLGGVSRIPNRVDAYQTAGELTFTPAGRVAFVGRELDIGRAVARAERTADGEAVTSAFIAHPECGLIVCRWAARTGTFSGTLRYARVPDAGAIERCAYGVGISYRCDFEGGIGFAVRVDLRTDGAVLPSDEGVSVTDAGYILAFVNIATGAGNIGEELAAYPVPGQGWDELLESHCAAFSELLGRLSLSVTAPPSDLPTDRRIARVREGKTDPGLMILYFNFGRYLLASSSIRGELPANLQGKWNDRIDPPWECDYHFDINLQMNYWMAEAADMPECAEALIRYLERFVPHARKAAGDLYGCRGIWLPIQADAWGRATPESYGWAVWVGAAPWIAQHVWRHYEYSGDGGYLRKRAYPFFRDVALFFEDYLTPDAEGVLQVMPSQSPENRFEGTGFWPVSIGISAAMDVQLVYDALGYAIRASEILDVDAPSRQKWRQMRDRLPPFAVGSDGQLLEWDAERAEVEPGHRHLSHLYGLYPSDLFNPADRPAQYEAAVRSLDARLSKGGGHTGWSRAWTACLCARIGRGGEMEQHLNALLTDFATISLLDLHPPRIFQIDGNLGAVAAVLEGLAQYWGGKVHLLRALPPGWPEGSVRGIRTPGGHRLSFSWSGGRLDELELTVGWGGCLTLAGLAGIFPPSVEVTAEGQDLRVAAPAHTVVRMRRA